MSAQTIQKVEGSKVVKGFGMAGNRLLVIVNGETFGKGKPDVEYIFKGHGRKSYDALNAAPSKGSYFCKNIAGAEYASKRVLS